MASFTNGPVVSVDPSLTSATVSWSADVASYGQVFYGLNAANLDGSFQDMNFTVDHSVLLNNLQPNQTYNYVVNIQDSNGNTIATSGNLTFSTAAPPATITSGPTANATPTSAEIAWSASVAGTGIVQLGTDATNMGQILTDSTVSQDHALTAQGLASSTQYFYTCSNANPNTGVVLVTSAVMNFTTAAPPLPTDCTLTRAQVSSRRVPKNGTVQVSIYMMKNNQPVDGAPVTFQVLTGNGLIIVGGQPGAVSGTANTDSTGRAVASFQAASTPQHHIVFVKMTSPNAVNSAFLSLLIRRH